MQIIPLASIVVRKRQRTAKSPKHIHELRDSILATTLIHPPVCWRDGEAWVLAVGECRFEAIKQITEMKRSFLCDDIIIEPGSIPILTLAEFMTAEDRFQIEFDENFIRNDPSWQDKTRALSDLHQLRTAVSRKQTLADTANELVETGVVKAFGGAMHVLREANLVAAHLDNPKISKARNITEAHSLVLKLQEESLNARIAQLQRGLTTVTPDQEVRCGDLLEILPRLDASMYDLILTDPPYGIGASSGGFRSRTVHHHNYEDTPALAQSLAQCILLEGFRVTKPRANLFMFCAIDLFLWLREAAERAGWSVFPRPLIWGKSDSEGLAPWGSSGPRITTEFIMYATKGRRGLLASPIDYFRVNRVPRNERLHGAEKPVELLKKLIECSTLQGESVLDPCCGSGSTLVACKESKRRGLGIERDEEYFNTALSNVHFKETTNDESSNRPTGSASDSSDSTGVPTGGQTGE